jgi:heme exporter protein C
VTTRKSKFTLANSLTVLLALLLGQWILAWFWVPVDEAQGEVYRIVYLHVPAAFASFLSAGVLLIGSLLALRSKSEHWLNLSRAAAEVGLLFTLLTLATGSIWGKPTWGVWWTWDARLTTSFLLALMYGGWILLFGAIPQGPSRTRSCSILGVMIAADVPIIYKSVTWWRTLHQPQTILRTGGSTMDGDMLCVLLSGIAIMALVSVNLILVRRETLGLEQELEEKSLGGAS